MKKVFFFLLSLPLAYFLGALAGKFDPTWKELFFFSKKQYLDMGFRPYSYPLLDHSFVVIINGKNSEYLEETFDSIVSQKYEPFRMVYIEDTSHPIQALPAGVELKTSLIAAIQSCADAEIVVVLAPGDLLAHEWVLDRLNRYYADPSLWITFSQYRTYPSLQWGMYRKIEKAEWEEKGFRGHPFVAAHLKTFYAALFKKIDPSDLMYQGQVLQTCLDFAYMVPMLEMAQDHFHCIEETLYLSREKIEEDPLIQQKIENHLRSLASYAPLPSLLQQRKAF